jgi:APA family basic amino acid/polyamine antiporter
MVAVKLTVVLAFVVLGAFYVRSANWHPFIPPNTGEFGSFGPSGILRGASIVFFAYIGFDAVSNCAQEARRPQRDMPIGILGSLAASTVLYIAVAAVLTGLVPYAELNVPDPVAKGVRHRPRMVLAVHRAGRADRAHHRHPCPSLRPEPDLRGHGE